MPARFYTIALVLISLSLPIMSVVPAFGDTKQQQSSFPAEEAEIAQDKQVAPNNTAHPNELLQQQIQNLQATLLEQIHNNQSKIAELQNTLLEQENLLKKLREEEKNTPELPLILSALGALLAAVTIIVALLSVFGYFGLKEAATSKARETADNVVKDEIKKGTFDKPISRAGQRTLNKMLSDGAFNSTIEEAVQRIAIGQSDAEDELDQEEQEQEEAEEDGDKNGGVK